MYDNYYLDNFEQVDWKKDQFKNFSKFIEDLKIAINDEKSAIDFYKKLLEVAPSELAKKSIQTALDDEKEHYKKLVGLYKFLTGKNYIGKVTEKKFCHFYDGLQNAFLDEVEAFEFYKEMYLSTRCQPIRDILYSIQHDEIEHATLFNWVYTDIK